MARIKDYVRMARCRLKQLILVSQILINHIHRAQSPFKALNDINESRKKKEDRNICMQINFRKDLKIC